MPNITERFNQEGRSLERGKNCVLTISFLRHANKTDIDPHKDGAISNTSLSEKGKINSQEKGKDWNFSKLVKQKTSEMSRAEETADNINLGANDREDFELLKSRVDKSLNPAHFSPAFIEQYRNHFKKLPANYSDLSETEQEKLIEDAEAPAVEYWLQLGDNKFDDETETAIDVAKRVAGTLVHYDRMIEKLKDNTEAEMMNITHRTVIEPILMYCLKPTIKNLAEIGGPINLLEDFVLKIISDDNGEKQRKLTFRGKEWELDWDKIQELVN